MNKVITINLNGTAYQVEEQGFDALRRYLDQASATLATNPDRGEILSDIEQSIGDKLAGLMGAYRNVATSEQVESVLSEMGPVESGGPEPAPAGGAAEPPPKSGETPPPGQPHRLYRLDDGAMVSGVCNGIGAYFGIDPTLVRIGWVILTVMSGGIGVAVYIALIFVIPKAATAEEKSAASGMPFNAQDFIRRAREGYYSGAKQFSDPESHEAWRRKFRREMRSWGRTVKWGAVTGSRAWEQRWRGYWAAHPGLETGWGIALPVLSVLMSAATVLFFVLMVTLLAEGTLMGVALPEGLPAWGAILLLFLVYILATAPFKAARHLFYQYGLYGGSPGSRVFLSTWDAVVGLACLGVLIWLASRNVPMMEQAIKHVPDLFRQMVEAMQRWWTHA
ncbi:MAG: PspC domain-containing protein [Verrucomicrobiota bacterium]